MPPISGPVRVRVPATSANLGPGFDALGLALTLHDDVEARILPAGLSIQISGRRGPIHDAFGLFRAEEVDTPPSAPPARGT
jgi:hypothetical protein